MIKTELVWNDAKVKPERDGKYLMVTKYGLVDSILFADGRWNCFYCGNGVLFDKNAFSPDSDYVRLWAEWPSDPEGVIE